jgi:rubrerythrin
VQLGTFGAILKYAIEIEDAASLYYDELAKKVPEDAKMSIYELSNASKKNKQTLERTRRMEMQEMILEAITGIDTVNYVVKFDVPSDFKTGLMNAVEIEKKASAFYSDSSKKLGFLPNVGKTLEKLAKEREVRAEKIKAFL